MAKIETTKRQKNAPRAEFATLYVPACFIIIALIIVFSFCVWKLINGQELIQNLISFMSLVFAMLVGYFAFDEFKKSKIREYKKRSEEAHQKGNYEESKINLEMAYDLGDRERDLLLNLAELSAAFCQFDKSKKIIKDLETLDSYEDKLTLQYLLLLNAFGEDKIEKAREAVKEMFVISTGKNARYINWGFDEIEKEFEPHLEARERKILAVVKEFFKGSVSPDQSQKNIEAISWL